MGGLTPLYRRLKLRQISKIKDFAYKMLIFAMYAELDLDYVRRQDNRFIIETRPLCHRFRITMKEFLQSMSKLEEHGYIFNFSKECGRVRFYVNFPKYLTLSSKSDELAKHVAENRSSEVAGGKRLER